MPADGDDRVGSWCRAIERRDLEAVAECLSPDVELNTPLTDVAVRGRQQVRQLLNLAFSLIEQIEFHTRLDGPEHSAVFARARFGGQAMDEALLLELDPATGLIRRLTLFVRPLPAVIELNAALTELTAQPHP